MSAHILLRPVCAYQLTSLTVAEAWQQRRPFVFRMACGQHGLVGVRGEQGRLQPDAHVHKTPPKCVKPSVPTGPLHLAILIPPPHHHHSGGGENSELSGSDVELDSGSSSCSSPIPFAKARM